MQQLVSEALLISKSFITVGLPFCNGWEKEKMIRWMNFLWKRWWIVLGLSIAFVVQIIYDFLGEPIFTNIMPKQWWGLLIGMGLFAWLAIEGRKIKQEARKSDGDNNPTWGNDGRKAWVVWEKGIKEKIINNLKRLYEEYGEESSLLKEKLSEVLKMRDKLKTYLGYYHSRIIVSIYVPSMKLEGLQDIRNLRKVLSDSIEIILNDFLEQIKKDPPSHPVKYVRCYPLVEIGESLFDGVITEEQKENQREYGFESTCFYYDIPDVARSRIKVRKVKMRVSGAKIILSKISDKLFWDLVNLVYYHGLYSYKPPQTTHGEGEGITFYLYDQLLARLAEEIHREFSRLANTLLTRRYMIIALMLSAISISIAVIIGATVKMVNFSSGIFTNQGFFAH